ncbi:MAG: hypothetical protein KDA78_01570 [Planctomycetaceae bacterium]|nr:hypothetical protein [Planctomycetaceae bacterium]
MPLLRKDLDSHWVSAQLCAFFGVLTFLCPPYQAAEPSPQFPRGNCRIAAPLLDSEIEIRTTERLAGAIDSLVWRGKEFINSTDHGRQLQSASNLDWGGPMIAETFNPTEAGSVADGAGERSSSRLLFHNWSANRLETVTQMAFWLPPGGNSLGNPARNTTLLSQHLLSKQVQIGLPNLPQSISYQVQFSLPVSETHRFAQFEALTGYMPPEFTVFEIFDPGQNQVRQLSDGPGEQPFPILFSTTDGQFAMGCFGQAAPVDNLVSGPTYGRFRFQQAQVVKWNIVYRYSHAEELPSGAYPFRMFVLVGTRDLVIQGLKMLSQSGKQ